MRGRGWGEGKGQMAKNARDADKSKQYPPSLTAHNPQAHRAKLHINSSYKEFGNQKKKKKKKENEAGQKEKECCEVKQTAKDGNENADKHIREFVIIRKILRK